MGRRGRDGGNKRGRTQRRDFRDGRPNVWKKSRPEPSADQPDAQPSSETGWMPFVMESTSFELFYKKQCIVPEEEWSTFISTLKKPLPTTFRINGSGQFAHGIRDQMQRDFFDYLKDGAEVDGEEVAPARPLLWYPDNLAWHLSFSRMQLRKLPILERIHEFLKQENEIGSITRQEAVSMIPPLFLKVEPHHKVLDMCAAPGSKTFQLLEMIHQADKPGELPDGMVIANDSDVQRCHLLIHQTKRMCSPNILVTNHDAQLFPGLKDKSCRGAATLNEGDTEGPVEDGNRLLFDRILCDVPCSGDGTLRKAPDIWRKWNCGVANGLHRLQVQIAMRGVAILKVGGRLVYSTCSLNPVEDEAVVGEILRASGGSVELLDVSSELPELKRRPGMMSWKIRDRKRWLCSASQVNRHRAGVVVPSMFPSGNGWDSSDADEKNEGPDETESEEGPPEIATLPLERSMRILPHDQDTGGFFIAVFQKISPLKASITESIPSLVSEGSQHENQNGINRDPEDHSLGNGVKGPIMDIPVSALEEDEVHEDEEEVTDRIAAIVEEEEVEEEGEGVATTANQRATGSRFQRQGRWRGVDPVLFLEDEKVISSLVAFYGIKETFPLSGHLVTRSEDSSRLKRIYYVSKSVSDVIRLNFSAGEHLKMTSAGLKMFERQQPKDGTSPCAFRIASEGLPVLLPYMTKQIVFASKRDFKLLLSNKVVSFSAFSDNFSVALQNLLHGCCVVALPAKEVDGADKVSSDQPLATAVGCWRGRTNVSLLITKAEAGQMLQRLSLNDETLPSTAVDKTVQGAVASEFREGETAVVVNGDTKRAAILTVQRTQDDEMAGVDRMPEDVETPKLVKGEQVVLDPIVETSSQAMDIDADVVDVPATTL
ncbi:unnamed protein product [Sphagnum troendelagicum]|uniref:SAM-dependent MTase RsmB/NOP-type domain-containing protein n=1 Tax=Sphagnum troendelagicum TaxID=128251 RepID=A0ABP0URA4_9BRYO